MFLKRPGINKMESVHWKELGRNCQGYGDTDMSAMGMRSWAESDTIEIETKLFVHTVYLLQTRKSDPVNPVIDVLKHHSVSPNSTYLQSQAFATEKNCVREKCCDSHSPQHLKQPNTHTPPHARAHAHSQPFPTHSQHRRLCVPERHAVQVAIIVSVAPLCRHQSHLFTALHMRVWS